MSYELECSPQYKAEPITYSHGFNNMPSFCSGVFIFILFCETERSEAGNELERRKGRRNRGGETGAISVLSVGLG